MRRRGLLCAALLLAACGKKTTGARGQRLAAGAKVLALGDSITQGVGAAAQAAYPSV